MSAAPDILRVERLVAGYVPDLPILREVSICLPARKVVLVIGPNGAGKSTMVKAIAGLVPVFSGSIFLAEKPITGTRTDLLGNLGIAYVPQNDNIFRTLTVQQNLLLVLRGIDDAAKRMSALYELFTALGDKRYQLAGSLSGGQRQMLAIAMALARKPSVILLDEPSAGLSPRIAGEVLDLARGLTDTGVSVLLVEQNVREGMRIADYCYVLAEGRNQLDGPAERLAADPVVGEIYLGGRRMAPA